MKNSRILFLLLILASCKKEVELEKNTIQPMVYFPAYPGSYWNYFDSYTNDTLKMEVESEYKLHTYLSDRNYCLPTDSTYVPFINGVPYYGYSNPMLVGEIYYSNPDCEILIPFLSERIGTIIEFDSLGHVNKSNLLRVDSLIDTMTIRGVLYADIIEVKHLFYHGSYLKSETRFYYAKNVGRIRTLYLFNSLDTSNQGRTIDLINFHINL